MESNASSMGVRGHCTTSDIMMSHILPSTGVRYGYKLNADLYRDKGEQRKHEMFAA